MVKHTFPIHSPTPIAWGTMMMPMTIVMMQLLLVIVIVAVAVVVVYYATGTNVYSMVVIRLVVRWYSYHYCSYK